MKKYKSYVSWHRRVIQILKKTDSWLKLTLGSNNDVRNLVNFDPTLESLKICSLMGSFWSKYIMFELKNYRGVMCHDTEGWCDI